ncbi:mucin-5AC [Eurytemora carolleeae]|uniref:mucin-5AC n=1 Tax=Eurytemora carolleeae TaxID=1294199 RepID=UPI000C780FF9|nr:mucin-5AC [Eurytemora carolleeae]|eukprot:XP_023344136.1 mucin-5AC-like [Eurytemora affinis]
MADKEEDEVKDRNKSRLRYVLDGYAESSTVHGLNYTLDTELPMPDRCLLGTITLLFSLCAGYLVYGCVVQFIDSTVLISLQNTSAIVEDLSFPSVTICTGNLNMDAVTANMNRLVNIWIEEQKNNVSYTESLNSYFKRKFNITEDSAVSAFDVLFSMASKNITTAITLKSVSDFVNQNSTSVNPTTISVDVTTTTSVSATTSANTTTTTFPSSTVISAIITSSPIIATTFGATTTTKFLSVTTRAFESTAISLNSTTTENTAALDLTTSGPTIPSNLTTSFYSTQNPTTSTVSSTQNPTASILASTTSTQHLTTSRQDPTTTTQNPTTSSQDLGTSTQDPSTSRQDPTTSTQDPTTSTQDTTTSTQDPTTSTQNPKTSTQDPTIFTQDPTTSTQNPTTSTQDSATSTSTKDPTKSTQNLTTSTQNPTTSTQDPATSTSTQDPTKSTQDPTTSTQNPTTSTQNPTTSTQDPATSTSTQDPTKSTQNPTTSTQDPATSTSTQDPKTSTHDQKKTTQDPTTSTQDPTPSTQDPTTSTQDPTTSTQDPTPSKQDPTTSIQDPSTTTSTQNPTPSTQDLTTSIQDPTTTTSTQDPTTSTQDATTSTQDPKTSTQDPTTSTQDPKTSTQDPTTSTQDPTTSTQDPTTSTQNPTTSTQDLTTSTQDPTTSTQDPTKSTQNPTTATQDPTKSTQEPTTLIRDSTTSTQNPTTYTQYPTTTSSKTTSTTTVSTTSTPITESTTETLVLGRRKREALDAIISFLTESLPGLGTVTLTPSENTAGTTTTTTLSTAETEKTVTATTAAVQDATTTRAAQDLTITTTAVQDITASTAASMLAATSEAQEATTAAAATTTTAESTTAGPSIETTTATAEESSTTTDYTTTTEYTPTTEPFQINQEHASILEMLLDGKKHGQNVESLRETEETDLIEYFNSQAVAETFAEMFKILWFSSLPCFRTENITQGYLLKSCTYQGIEGDCRKMFRKVATDSGFCCAFNNHQQLQDSEYKTLMQTMTQEEINATTSEDTEYKIEPGLSQGLTVILDKHSNLESLGSVDRDWEGFQVFVGSPHEFPELKERGVMLEGGSEHYLEVTATKTTTTDDLRTESAEKRVCKFQDENGEFSLYKTYSRTNCLFECAVQGVSVEVGCVPWNLPKSDSARVCDPWAQANFTKLFENFDYETCTACLPDCTEAEYTTAISSAKFRRCDSRNFDLSPLCSSFPSSGTVIWADHVNNSFNSEEYTPTYLLPQGPTRDYYSPGNIKKEIFSSLTKADVRTYNAFERDIAVVHVYVASSVAIEFARIDEMSGISLVSMIGGHLGLFLGCSVISALELIYWFIYKLILPLPKARATANVDDVKVQAWA